MQARESKRMHKLAHFISDAGIEQLSQEQIQTLNSLSLSLSPVQTLAYYLSRAKAGIERPSVEPCKRYRFILYIMECVTHDLNAWIECLI